MAPIYKPAWMTICVGEDGVSANRIMGRSRVDHIGAAGRRGTLYGQHYVAVELPEHMQVFGGPWLTCIAFLCLVSIL